jgi:hypothetical protein
VKAYREVCADLLMMLEDLEESLEEINQTAELPENQPEISKTGDKHSWLETYFGFRPEK